MGKAAVDFALAGKNAVMPTIVRAKTKTYRWSIGEAALAKVANVEKTMPRHYITADGFGITSRCREYLTPLISGEDYPPFKNGMPQYARLRNVLVKKKLKRFVN
jgi:6-phosphofructokinase 1